MTNISKVVFDAGCTWAKCQDKHFQYDKGQYLEIEGLDLPTAFQVQFSNARTDGVGKEWIGENNVVWIPDEFFLSGEYIYAYIYMHYTGENDGRTYKAIEIPVEPRSYWSTEVPEPSQQSEIDAAISASQAAERAAEQAQEAAEAAQGIAEAAQAAAEDAAVESADSAAAAVAARERAETAGSRATQAAAEAEAARTGAETAATSAAASAADAANSADRAEQAAKDAGYMYFYIDDKGDLHYVRTSNVNVRFYLHEGDLYVEAIG